jgi:4a-hydroxytetrahydrobiopterin dehydratase
MISLQRGRPLTGWWLTDPRFSRRWRWRTIGKQIAQTFVRKDFASAITFVNEVAAAAEAAGHHPDIDIRWNKVTLALSSLAEGGLTDDDFQLAARILEFDQPARPA